LLEKPGQDGVVVGVQTVFAYPQANRADRDRRANSLHIFQAQPVECCPRAENFGYAASWWLLLAHLKYLTHRKPQPDVARATVRWLLTDDTSDFQRADTGLRTGTWFTWAGRQRWLRQLVAMASWLVVTIGLLLLGAIILPMLLEGVVVALGMIGTAVVALAPWVGRAADGLAKPFTWVSAPVAWLREARTAKLGFSSFAWSSFPGAGQLQPALGKSSLGRVSDAMHATPTDPVATRTTPVSFFRGGLPIFSFRPRPKQFAGGRCYWSRRQREQPLCRIEP